MGVVDLWINPADASSISALGAADWTLDNSGGTEVKWGRDGNALSGLSVTTPAQGRTDELRVATTFAELNLAPIPEPSAALLGGLGALLLLRRRRGQ